MKQLQKAERLSNVRYDVRGSVTMEALRMEKAGEKVIKLNIGNPAAFGIVSTPGALSAARERIGGCQAYCGANGLDDALEAIAAYASKKGIPDVKKDLIYTGNGVSELITMCMDALINPGDEVLIPTPDYPLWTAAAVMAGGTVRHYVCDEDSGWLPDIRDIESKISSRTKAIVIINPNNPTGALYPDNTLKEIALLAEKHSLVVFADEIYDRLLLSEKQHTSIASMIKDTLCITMNGLSKSHMLCGYRVGWMVLSGNTTDTSGLISGIDMLANMRLCANVPGQAVISEALSGTARAEEYFLPGGRIYEQVYGACSALGAIEGVRVSKPEAAFYLFPGVDTDMYDIRDDDSFAMDLLKKERVLIVPGNGFNWSKKGYFRVVCLPDAELMTEAAGRIGEYLKSIRK